MNENAAANEKDDQNEHLRSIMCLNMVPGVGPRLFAQLVEHFGSAKSVLDASESELLQLTGFGKKLAHAIKFQSKQFQVDDELQRCHDNEVKLETIGGVNYPDNLSEIYDPPALLYRKGSWDPSFKLAVAIVGTRHASLYGIRQAEKIAAGLAYAGVVVVSGMARGIDAAAHQGAIKAGGKTIAVLGGGVLNTYPPEHKELSKQIVENGCLLSEMPTLHAPRSSSFPRRNRIISGISLGVLVVEAAERSGSLITARHAMEQNRDVFAVPGSVESRVSKGCHHLIRDGATLVESVDNILEQLGPLSKPIVTEENREIRNPAELQLDEQQLVILDAIDVEPTSIDKIVERTQLPVPRVLASISILEMRRLIRRISGSSVARV